MEDQENQYTVYDRPQENGTISAAPQAATVDLTNSAQIAKVFGFTAIGIAITAAITMGLGYLLFHLISSTAEEVANYLFLGYIIALFVSFLIIMIIPLIIGRMVKKKAIAVWIPYIIYAVAFGIFLSMFAFILNPLYLGGAFLITGISFAMMSFFGIISKGKMKVWQQIASGLGIGLLICTAVCFLIYLFAPESGVISNSVYMAITGGLFVYTMIITMLDVNRLKRLALTTKLESGLMVYLGFTLFSDFAFMLLYALRFIALIVASSKK